MKARRFVFASVAFVFSFFTGTAIAQQCSHVSGGWGDNYGYWWTLDSSGNGQVWVDDECVIWWPHWPVTGSTGNGSVSLTAYDPGNDGCAAEFYYDGEISRGGCNLAAGNWSNTAGFSGSFSMWKACEVPSSETTSPTGGLWIGPYYVFAVTVSNTSGGDLSGRLYREADYSTGIDGCWYSGSPIPAWTGVTGGATFLSQTNFYTDTIGWGDAAIQHYRAHGDAPCSTDLFQRMQISCGTESTPSPWETVQSQVLHVTIGTTTLTTSRGSVTQGPQPY